MLFQIAVTAGFAMLLSCFGVLFEDLRLFSTHALRLGFYISPGLFGIDLVSESLDKKVAAPWNEVLYVAYMTNPFAILITGYRDSVLYGAFIPGHWWIILLIESLFLLWVGYRVYQYYDRRVIKFL